jgi:predicted NBD/HSP70 family sugar kinase
MKNNAPLRGALARALAGVINVLDPDVIVLGGGTSNGMPVH